MTNGLAYWFLWGWLGFKLIDAIEMWNTILWITVASSPTDTLLAKLASSPYNSLVSYEKKEGEKGRW